MANITRFQPLDGVPDADARGAGTFFFDDGSSMVSEDAELADLVRSYQDTLPQLEATLPDQRTASLGLTGVGGVGQSMSDFAPSAPPAAKPVVGDPAQAIGSALASQGAPGFTPPTPPSLAASPPSPAPGPGPAPMGGSAPLPAPPSDAERAAELHRLAGDRALQGSYVAPRAAGYTPAQRTGALDPAIAARQAAERGQTTEQVLQTTEQARMQEAEALRKSALDEAMRLSVQRAEQERIQQEAEAKRQRLLAERRAINDAKIDTSYAQGNGFRQALALLGSALLGATGSDAGLRMIESNIDQHVRKEMQVKGSKLQALADELGSEEQAIAGAKSRLYDLVAKEAQNAGKLYDAAKLEHQTPAILAGLKQRAQAEEQEHERQSLGKTVETYQQARAGGRTGPDLGAAAKHYEAANKLKPEEKAQITQGLSSTEATDFTARMEGLADGEHAMNEIDQNIGIQRDEAGEIANRKDILSGNIEGAGFFGGRTPNAALSEKGSALGRSVLRMTRAGVKATNGAGASDTEFERAEKDTPLTDEKDLLNATTEKRRQWQKDYAKAVTLYGKERVDQFLGGYRGTRANINSRRGQTGNTGSARGQVIQLDGDS